MIRDDGGFAFPDGLEYGNEGMSLRDYFIAHAPSEPASWFDPVIPIEAPAFTEDMRKAAIAMMPLIGGAAWDMAGSAEHWAYKAERLKQRYIQWPAAWADAMMEARK